MGTACTGICLPGSPLDCVYSSLTRQGNLAVFLSSFHLSASASVLLDPRGPLWCCCVLQYRVNKVSEWLSIRWMNPTSFKLKYGENLSEIITVQGSTNSRTSLVTKVSHWRPGTRKTSLRISLYHSKHPQIAK